MADDSLPPTDTTPARDPEIEPETKDWTWVLDRRCPACGFVAADIDVRTLPTTVRALTARWQAALARSTVRERPRPGMWSVLEYGAHMRDVNRLCTERVRLMRERGDPALPSWDQDAAAVADRYGEQDPARVADQLAEEAERFAAQYAQVRADELERPGRRSDGSVFTVRTLGLYYLHEVVHHLHDVGA